MCSHAISTSPSRCSSGGGWTSCGFVRLSGVVITRVRRESFEFVPRGDFVLEIGDQIRAVGYEPDIQRFAQAGRRQRATPARDRHPRLFRGLARRPANRADPAAHPRNRHGETGLGGRAAVRGAALRPFRPNRTPAHLRANGGTLPDARVRTSPVPGVRGSWRWCQVATDASGAGRRAALAGCTFRNRCHRDRLRVIVLRLSAECRQRFGGNLRLP